MTSSSANGEPGAARAGNRRAPSVVSAKRPHAHGRAAASPPAVEEPVGPPPGRPSFGLTRRSSASARVSLRDAAITARAG